MRKWQAMAGSAIFFLVAPGAVAGLAPFLLTGWRVQPAWWPLRVAGAALAAAGLAVLLDCFWRFASEGRGTPAPNAPTERLVTGGAYRFVRNPMYVSVLAAILGQTMLLGQPVLVDTEDGPRPMRARDGDVLTIRLGRSRVRVVSPDALPELIPSAKPPAVPALIGFTVTVTDLDAARALLTDRDVPLDTFGDTLLVPATHAAGAVVSFIGGGNR